MHRTARHRLDYCEWGNKKLKEIYDEIYKKFDSLKYEIEQFYENGKCQIKYYW